MLETIYCQVETIHYELKEGTKTVYIETERNKTDFTEEQYNNCVEASPFFRRLGGSETQSKTYTRKGYKVYEIISKSPDRTKKTIRRFNLDV